MSNRTAQALIFIQTHTYSILTHPWAESHSHSNQLHTRLSHSIFVRCGRFYYIFFLQQFCMDLPFFFQNKFFKIISLE